MIKLSNGGAYLINGTEVIEDGNEELLKSKLGSKYLSKEEAGKNTIASLTVGFIPFRVELKLPLMVTMPSKDAYTLGNVFFWKSLW